MQLAVIEFARSVIGWGDAQSTEFDPQTKHPVVSWNSFYDVDTILVHVWIREWTVLIGYSLGD